MPNVPLIKKNFWPSPFDIARENNRPDIEAPLKERPNAKVVENWDAMALMVKKVVIHEDFSFDRFMEKFETRMQQSCAQLKRNFRNVQNIYGPSPGLMTAASDVIAWQ